MSRASCQPLLGTCTEDGQGSYSFVFSLEAGQILTWHVTERGLYVGSRHEPGDISYDIDFFDLASGQTTHLLTTPGRLGFHLVIDPLDGRSIIFDQTEAIDSDIFAIQGH